MTEVFRGFPQYVRDDFRDVHNLEHDRVLVDFFLVHYYRLRKYLKQFYLHVYSVLE